MLLSHIMDKLEGKFNHTTLGSTSTRTSQVNMESQTDNKQFDGFDNCHCILINLAVATPILLPPDACPLSPMKKSSSQGQEIIRKHNRKQNASRYATRTV